MDIHDIRYLHDEGVSNEDDPKDNFIDASLFTRKNIVTFGIIGFLLLSVGIVTLNLSKQTSTKSSAQKLTESPSNILAPTGAAVQVKGKIVCAVGKSPDIPGQPCPIELKADSGRTYSLENVQYEDIQSGALLPGKIVTIQGTEGISKSAGSAGTVFVTSVSSTNGTTSPSNTSQNTSAPTVSVPTITPTPTVTPTPTPIPHFVDSTPSPGLSYLTIQYIRDHADSLLNTQVNVGAFLVGGNIGEDGCVNAGICTYSNFILSDTNNPDRDQSQDMQMIGSISEKEEDYTTGQPYYHKVTVVIENSVVSLQKVY